MVVWPQTKDSNGIFGGRARGILLAIGDNWLVTYACRPEPEMELSARSEWVWIMSRTPELAERDIEEAKSALAEVFPDYDVKLLAAVPQTDCKPLN